MLFDRKIKRVIDVEKAEETYKNREPEPLEKGDGLAMFLAALRIFGPVLVVILGLFWLVEALS